MPGTWPTARAQLALLLGQIEATVDDETYSCTAVEFPQRSIAPGQGPIFILALPEVPNPPRRMSSWRETDYRVAAGLFVTGDDVTLNAKLLDAFREATLDKFDASVALDGNADYIIGPSVVAANDELFGGIARPHVDFFFDIRVSGAVTVGP